MAHLRTPTGLACTLFVLLAPAPAQVSTAVIPATFENKDAPGTAFWALPPFEARRQLLIDERHLPGLRGKFIRSLWLRRNAGSPEVVAAGSVHLQVSLSHARAKADLPTEKFAANRGPSPVLAFSGALTLPATPPPKQSPAPWRVEIRLRPPFLYGGGTLCVETVTKPIVSGKNREAPWWPIDAITNAGGGAVSSIGSSCIPKMGPEPAGADAAGFSPGATATVFLRGRTDLNHAVCWFGTSSRRWGSNPLPLDLRLFGAPGCHVYINLLGAIPVTIARLPNSSVSYGSWSVQMPSTPAVVGLSLYSQWVATNKTNRLGLVTSNAVRATVGALTSLTGLSWIENPDPGQSEGRVLLGRFPALRFDAYAR